MVRINLLPREVLERRRYEKWYGYVAIAFGALFILVLLVYAGVWLTAQSKIGQLQLLQEQSQKMQAQADAFAIFEKKEQDLAKREAIATAALQGRVNMGRIAEEVSLVLPDEVWLQTMLMDRITGLELTAYTPFTSGQSMDTGYKSVAKTLVRLNELPTISDVWLTTASNVDFTGFVVTEGVATLPAPTVSFHLEAKVLSGTESTSSGTPATSNGSTQ